MIISDVDKRDEGKAHMCVTWNWEGCRWENTGEEEDPWTKGTTQITACEKCHYEMQKKKQDILKIHVFV